MTAGLPLFKWGTEELAMPSLSTIEPAFHPALPGVKIFPLSGPPKVGIPQDILVEIEPDGSIPLHSHAVDAEMFIIAGSGWVCSTDETNGRPVSLGWRVFFEADEPHGFRAGKDGLTFISANGGIVDSLSEHWDLEMT